MVEYKKLDLVDGKIVEVESKTINPHACPNMILSGDHYHDDTCDCFNPNAIELKKLGYKWNEDKGYWDSAMKMNLAKAKKARVRKVKCVSCENKFLKEDMTSTFDNDPICESCLSDDQLEPAAWVFHILNQDEEFSMRIGRYFNETDGDFTVSWHNSDGWRGYYEVVSEKYTKIHDDCALSYSEDEQNLKQFDEILTELARKHKIGIVRVVTRTSNLFSMGVDYFVHNSHLKKYNRIIEQVNSAKKGLRDSHAFNMTVINGE